ncbi:protein-glutamine gamma-glutamyltransferase [Paenibacillus spongiae]|uniref:Protein-glutamine gamma-glutamyltransferase n=1 Tax=Paenibacillus spongiae TaxID=2909671 RepID=A0ABY5SD89_9BACL|nr:protein-glutamine gamma-glutamyltransferase [Paenibacillus spongiae]UVI30700.1 protein-glutamine gamma-glutamyltransferase [Paenibacillus spongiae]
MIIVANMSTEQLNEQPFSQFEQEVVQKKEDSPVVYRYPSLEALKFELKLRANIVQAAKDLYASRVDFAVFSKSRSNEQFWTRTPEGGFRLNSGVRPSDGINDIYRNGRMYAFECATAMVILLYKAVLDTIGEDAFNTHFQNLLLYTWQYDDDLRLISVDNKNEAYLGDILYFMNPDYNPQTPEWQGENAVMLPNGLFYGHGIGIKTAEEMIASLNRRRIPGSDVSAYLSDEVVHPDFEHIRRLASSENAHSEREKQRQRRNAIVVRIGNSPYMQVFDG